MKKGLKLFAFLATAFSAMFGKSKTEQKSSGIPVTADHSGSSKMRRGPRISKMYLTPKERKHRKAKRRMVNASRNQNHRFAKAA